MVLTQNDMTSRGLSLRLDTRTAPKKRGVIRIKGKKIQRLARRKRTDVRINSNKFLPEVRMARLTYKAAASQSVNHTTQNNFSHAYRMNSIYDTDYSNYTKNKSVEMYTQIASMYNYYHVYGFQAKVTIFNTCGNPIRVFCGMADSSTWTSDFAVGKIPSDISSRQGIKNKCLSPEGGNNDSCTFTFKCLPRQVLGLSKAEYSNVTYGASMGNNPAPTGDGRVPLFIVGHGPMVEAGILDSTIQYSIEIKLYTKLQNHIDNVDV